MRSWLYIASAIAAGVAAGQIITEVAIYLLAAVIVVARLVLGI